MPPRRRVARYSRGMARAARVTGQLGGPRCRRPETRGPQDTLRHLGLLLPECRMHRCDDDVELGQTLFGEVELTVCADIALDPGEYRDIREPCVDLPDGGRMLECTGLVKAFAIASA